MSIRYQSTQFGELNTQFFKGKSHFQDSFDLIVKNLKVSYNLQNDVRLDSISSLSDSGHSEDSRDEKSSAGSQNKLQYIGDKKQKNFQVKKKTELCKTFQLGHSCPYGSKCSFAHGVEEIRAKVLVPSNYKTVKCKQFFERGHCNFGPRCQFLHNSQTSSHVALPALSFQKTFEAVLQSLIKENTCDSVMKTHCVKTSGTVVKRLGVFKHYSGC